MFQFPESRLLRPMNSAGDYHLSMAGLPHSDTAGSQLDYSSPTLFIRVLLRLLMPRHSPFALSSLALFIQILSTKDALSNIHTLEYFHLAVSISSHTHSFRCRIHPSSLQKGCTLCDTHLRKCITRYPIFIFQRASLLSKTSVFIEYPQKKILKENFWWR